MSISSHGYLSTSKLFFLYSVKTTAVCVKNNVPYSDYKR